MALALNLLFDRATNAAVSQSWQELADAGISSDMLGLGYPPHLTLLVMDDEQLVPIFASALSTLARLAPASVRLGEVRSFDGTAVVYLGCEGDLTDLRNLHRAAAACVPEEGIRPYYRPASWTPHVTLQTIGDVAQAMELTRRVWTPGRVARATRLELATFLPVVVGEGIDLA